MIVSHVQFIRPIPVLGSSKREEQFYASDGWLIEVHDYGVTLSRPANPEQNILETSAFCTCGVGYSVPAPSVSEETAARVEAAAEYLTGKVAAPIAVIENPLSIAAEMAREAAGKPVPYYERKGKR